MKKNLLMAPLALLLAASCNLSPATTEQTQPKPTPWQQVAQNPTPTATSTPKSDNYLVVKEWGVEFQKPVGMEDLNYIVKYNAKTDGAVYFSTQQIVNLDRQFGNLKTYCDADQASLGSLGRANHVPGPNDKPWPTNLKIGNYYYWFDEPQATCSDNKQVQQLETKQAQALATTILKSLQNLQK